MKKILSFILAALMVVSCAAFVSADAANGEVYDAQSFAIQFLADHGIFKGVSSDPDVVDPDAATLIRRYQMALFVSRIATGFVDDRDWENGNENVTTFTDLTTEPVNKYLGAISYAKQQGIIEGRTETTFDPYGAITYREALAMLVRSLGYKGLSYPWGVIQKAVELGLTEDIDGVAYTDRVTRGQVAIMVYNALFAKTAAGKTLADVNFDAEYGWENILIVSSDKYSFQGEAKAKKNFVGFKVLNDNGTLQNKTYYVAAADLGLTGHADELAVGTAYLAMFKIEDNDFASMNYYYSLADGYVMNIGVTDNTGAKVGTQPIKAYLDAIKYTFVPTYSNYKGSNILSEVPDGEMILLGQGTYKVFSEPNMDNIAINIKTGDILVKGDDGEFEVRYYYSRTVNMYYTNEVDAAGKLYNGWYTPEQVQDFFKSDEFITVTTQSTALGVMSELKGTKAYAKLSVYDLDADGYADRGIYKEYQIGSFSVVNKKCDPCDAKKDHYVIKSIHGDTTYVEVCSACTAFLNIESSVRGFDGTKADFVLYNYNAESGELEIVKAIKGGMDYDSGYATGLVTAYSVLNNTVTINGTTYPIGYKGIGSGFDFDTIIDGDSSKGTKAKFAEILANAQMQYVTALVVDGRVIEIELQGTEKGHLIVSLGYAGYTADGYLAVYGYSTFGGYGVYEIDSINGWKRGDAQYYLWNVDDAFAAGTILSVKSQNGEAYSVYIEDYAALAANAPAFSVSFVDTYRSVNGGALEAMTAAQKYVIIGADRRTIYVKEGIFDGNGYSITGAKAIKYGDTYVIFVTADTAIKGFNTEQYDIGFVQYKGDGIYSANYGDNALLGSTTSTAYVLNLLTNTMEVTPAFDNVVLKTGHVYKTIGGMIVEDMGVPADNDEIVNIIMTAYSNDKFDAAKYVVKARVEVPANIVTFNSKGKLSEDNELEADKFWAKEFGLLDGVDGKLIDIVATAKMSGTLKHVVGTVSGDKATVTIILNRANNNYIVYVH